MNLIRLDWFRGSGLWARGVVFHLNSSDSLVKMGFGEFRVEEPPLLSTRARNELPNRRKPESQTLHP